MCIGDMEHELQIKFKPYMHDLILSYVTKDVDYVMMNFNPTKHLLKILFDISRNNVSLDAEQVADLKRDIQTIKSHGHWDTALEGDFITGFEKTLLFVEQVKKLPLEEQQRYITKLKEEFELCIQ